ncbi:hypothetical protein N7326_08230 [Corynebacterium sp. ES2794-CONJ1]|uniref:hypothetical protein n=1 Tax=unclassified Corynebacterium TaxID=2624378 RepID=UPI00216AF31C|nr:MULTISPECIES: hypothetical protein [unclassified Corynebacterium]MCS4532453.1 hypothetical protein [Corynebacterium sp. ES2730-CONJ]MCU9519848.1 hypothetical protein [Corynebacterium sp. ES2794-CONJ1]
MKPRIFAGSRSITRFGAAGLLAVLTAGLIAPVSQAQTQPPQGVEFPWRTVACDHVSTHPEVTVSWQDRDARAGDTISYELGIRNNGFSRGPFYVGVTADPFLNFHTNSDNLFLLYLPWHVKDGRRDPVVENGSSIYLTYTRTLTHEDIAAGTAHLEVSAPISEGPSAEPICSAIFTLDTPLISKRHAPSSTPRPHAPSSTPRPHSPSSTQEKPAVEKPRPIPTATKNQPQPSQPSQPAQPLPPADQDSPQQSTGSSRGAIIGSVIAALISIVGIFGGLFNHFLLGR